MTTIQIKKDGQDPQVINVPKGAKIIIEDGVTIVEPEFKDGDIVASTRYTYPWVGIYRSPKDNNFFNYHARFSNNETKYSDYASIGLCQRHATPAEKQQLIDALAKDGMQWNPGTKQIEELKYIPKDGDCVEFDTDENNDKKGYFVAKIIDGKIFDSGDWLAINHTEIDKKSSIDYDVETFSFRKITPEELQAKFNELGYEYNFETHTAEKLRWKPKVNEEYYVPSPDCESLYYCRTNNCVIDTHRINKNLAFKTPEEAIEVAKKWLQQL